MAEADLIPPPVPRWFTLWRRILFIVASLLIISLIISIIIPLALRPLTPGGPPSGHDTQMPIEIETLTRWGLLAWFVGLALGLLAILIGVRFMLRRGRKQGLARHSLGLADAAQVGLAVASLGGVIVEMNSVVNFIFPDFNTTECSYQIRVVAFEDRNANGVQDAGEQGIPQAKITLQHLYKPPTAPAQTTFDTDSSGSASLALYAYSCYPKDTISVSAALPAGYAATTPLSFGPFPVTYYPKQPPSQSVTIGLRKN